MKIITSTERILTENLKLEIIVTKSNVNDQMNISILNNIINNALNNLSSDIKKVFVLKDYNFDLICEEAADRGIA